MLVLERACYLLTERLLWIIPGVRVHEAAQMMCPYWYRKKELWTRKKFGTLQSLLSDSGQQVCISCWNWVSWVYFRELDGKSCLAQDYVDAGNCYALTWFVEGWETSCDKPGNVLLWPGECCSFPSASQEAVWVPCSYRLCFFNWISLPGYSTVISVACAFFKQIIWALRAI